MEFERLTAERFAREAIRTARAEALRCRTQNAAMSTRTTPGPIVAGAGADTSPWHVRYRPWLIGGGILAAFLLWRRWQRHGGLWPNPSRRAILKRRAYLRAMRSPELAELQPADREHAAKALTALFDQNWKPWLKRITKKGVDVHDATYWLPTKPSPELAKFLRAHVTDVPRKRREDLVRFMADLEAIARGWDKLEPEERVGSVREVAKRIPEVAYPDAKHVGLSREAAAMGISPTRYKEIEARWLQAVNKGTKKRLPSIYLSFKGNTGEYTVRSLGPADPMGLFLGAQDQTKCCQKPGFEAESCAWHGVESPNGMFYVMETEDGELVAMSWAWRRDKYVVLDSIESRLTLEPPQDVDAYHFHQALKKDIAKGFDTLGKAIIRTDPNIAEVRVGGGYGSAAQEIVRSLGWSELSASRHGRSNFRDMDLEEKLRAKALDAATTKIVLHPARCYSDAYYTQFVVARQPTAKPQESPPIDKIIDDPYISNKQRYNLAKKLPPSLKMTAAILGINFTDRQRIAIAKEARAGDRHNAALIDLLSEKVAPGETLPFLFEMTEKQLCSYLVKHGDEMPMAFFYNPRALIKFLQDPRLPEKCVYKRRRFGSDERFSPRRRIANRLLFSRVIKPALEKEPPVGRQRMTHEQVYWLIDTIKEGAYEDERGTAIGNALGILSPMRHRTRYESPRSDVEMRMIVKTDVGSALRARFVSLFLEAIKLEAQKGWEWHNKPEEYGAILGSSWNGVSAKERLRLFYRIVDDPSFGLTRHFGRSDYERRTLAAKFTEGFIKASRGSLTPRQLDRLLSKMLVEHSGKAMAYASILENLIKPIAEKWDIPRDMRFTMVMLLEPADRKEILFKYAATFTKAQIYDILNIGPMSKAQADAEAKVTSNPLAWSLRGIAGILES